MQLIQLIYVSRATGAIDPAGLESILRTSQRNNERLDITGLLIYSGGHFMQLLEGPNTAVLPLFETIRRDDRHHDVRQLMVNPCGGRVFANWSMALMNLDAVAELDVERLREFMRHAPVHRPIADGGRTVLAMLHDFKQQMLSAPFRGDALRFPADGRSSPADQT